MSSEVSVATRLRFDFPLSFFAGPIHIAGRARQGRAVHVGAALSRSNTHSEGQHVVLPEVEVTVSVAGRFIAAPKGWKWYS